MGEFWSQGTVSPGSNPGSAVSESQALAVAIATLERFVVYCSLEPII